MEGGLGQMGTFTRLGSKDDRGGIMAKYLPFTSCPADLGKVGRSIYEILYDASLGIVEAEKHQGI